jgi:cytochrome b6
MVASVFVHFFSTYLMKAYRKPRELIWMSGVILLSLVLAFGFTGYLLPWNANSYFATQIGTEIPRSIPILGEFIVNILRGGEFVAAESLTRLFALHVVVLPIISLLVILYHLVLNQMHGTSVPISCNPVEKGIPFYPNHLYRDFLSWTFATALLFIFVFMFPVQLGTKADPFASAPLGIKPEWYFLVLFQTLRLMPGTVFGVNGEMLVNVGVLLVGLMVILVPILDRRAAQEHHSPVFTLMGWAGMLYMIVAISLAYLT